MTEAISTLDAARLILADYTGALQPDARLDIEGVQSAIIGHNNKPILVIRGSDECSDWIRNFRFLPEPAPGDSASWWHRGFLQHAQVAYSWARDKPVSCVIGHSLGAACVQIVATSFGVTGIAFASPRPLWSPAGNRPPNETLVVNYCRTDDVICYVPMAALGFDHVGVVHWLTPSVRNRGEDHRIQHYLTLLDVAEDVAAALTPSATKDP